MHSIQVCAYLEVVKNCSTEKYCKLADKTLLIKIPVVGVLAGVITG